LKRASPANPLFKNYKKISGSADTPLALPLQYLNEGRKLTVLSIFIYAAAAE
jgi:hypothetical protein